MEQERVWLGGLRRPVQLAMFGFTAIALLTFAWLVVSRLFLGSEVGMHELLRPAGLPAVQSMLWSLLGSILSSALYLLGQHRRDSNLRPRASSTCCRWSWSRIAMIGVVFIVLVMFYEVVSRYVFNKPTLWANELSLWLAAFLFLLAGLYAMQQRSHIRIYMIYDLMPRWAQKTSDCISVFLIWVFAFCLVWGGYDEAIIQASADGDLRHRLGSADPGHRQIRDPSHHLSCCGTGAFQPDCRLEQGDPSITRPPTISTRTRSRTIRRNAWGEDDNG